MWPDELSYRLNEYYEYLNAKESQGRYRIEIFADRKQNTRVQSVSLKVLLIASILKSTESYAQLAKITLPCSRQDGYPKRLWKLL